MRVGRYLLKDLPNNTNMGFNISGIVINKNLKEQQQELSKMLNLDLKFSEEIDFETASENWKDEGIIDVYFGENGTLVFVNEDLCLGNGYSYPDTSILTFAMSETSMAFNFEYTENEKHIRSKMVVNEEVIDEEGIKLKAEYENDDTSEHIWQQLSLVLGKSFWSIEPDEKAYRFLIREAANKTEQEIIEPRPVVKIDKFDFSNLYKQEDLETQHSNTEMINIVKPIQDIEEDEVAVVNKKWWQFWK